MPEDDKVIRYQYGWFPKISILEELPGLYEALLNGGKRKEKGPLEGLRYLLLKQKAGLKILEFAVVFLLFEWLNGVLGNQAQFQMIDLRLLFIVLFSSLYGINYGIAAALAEAVSLIRQFEREDISWYVLFYEPSTGSLLFFTRCRSNLRLCPYEK